LTLITRWGKADVELQDLCRLESRFNSGKLPCRSDEQANLDHQNDRGGGLQTDDGVPQTTTATRGTDGTCAITQLLCIRWGEPQRGEQPEDQRRDAGDEDAGREHASVHLHVGKPELVAAKPLQAHDAPGREEKADDACSRGHDRALGHYLADAMAARSAERGMDSELMPAGHRLRDDHTGDVGARDHDHEQPDQHEDREQDSNVEAGGFDERQHGRADLCVRIRMFGLQLPGDRVELGSGLCSRDALFEPACHYHVTLVAAAPQRIDDEGREDLGVIEQTHSGFGREGADHGVRNRVERHALSDDIRTCRELSLPEPMRDQRDRFRSCESVLCTEGTTEHRCQTPHAWQVGSDLDLRDAQRHVKAGQVGRSLPEASQLLERRGPRAPVGEIRNRRGRSKDDAARIAFRLQDAGVGGRDIDKPFLVDGRDEVPDHVNHAVDHRRCRDRHTERRDDDERGPPSLG